MITLHEVYEQGSNEVKAAVVAFGERHPANDGSGPETGPDWKYAEQHFTRLIEVIMGSVVRNQPGVAATVRRAENESIGFLLAVNSRADYCCPICARPAPAFGRDLFWGRGDGR